MILPKDDIVQTTRNKLLLCPAAELLADIN